MSKAAPPEGLVTLVFTDIEGSTNLLRENGDAFGEILADHDLLLRESWQQQHGVEVRTEGDAFFVAFASPRAAIAAVSSAQQALAAHRWPHGSPVRVRMGVHSGEVQLRDGDYLGIDVHYAARLCAAAHGGQVLLSAATLGLVADTEVDDLGEHALKDFPVARRLYHLVIDGQRSNVFPPPRTLTRSGSNLPSESTSLLGRQEEISKVEQLLGHHRLVVVVGAGGAGKTRLALAVARRVAGCFEDGARLVELAPIEDPALVPLAAAEAFGVRQTPGMSLTESLAAVVGSRHTLIVLDNCEHVIDAAADLCDRLLRSGLDLHLLATSREPLHVEGEVRFPLDPLAVPALGASAEEAARSAAVALFVERARGVSPDFELSPASVDAVTRIVGRLDGMPLAIELAAAQIDTLGLDQLGASLDDRFRVLVSSTRGVSPRQASLGATVEWSYRLLDDGARRAFRRLSVFPSPFTLDAGTATAGGPPHLVATLVRRSLLNPPRAGEDGRSRYAMLETVRAYALERLEESSEREQAEGAMAAWIVDEAERVSSSFSGPNDGVAGWWGDAEQDNVRAAMEWLLRSNGRNALRLSIAMCPWAFLRGHYREGRLALENALAVSSADGSDLLPTVELWLGRLAHYSSHLGDGLDHFRRAEAMLRPHPQSGDLVDALVGQAWELCNLDQTMLALEKAQDALAMARAIGYGSGESHALGALSVIELYSGDYASALAWARQASAVDRDRSSGHATRFALTSEALAWASMGDLDSAERLLAENLVLCRQAGDRSWEALQLESLARIEIKTERWAEAAVHVGDATRISAEVGEALRLADCLATAAVWAARQNPDNAAVLWGAGHVVAETISPYRVPLAEIVDRADLTSAEDSAFYTQPMLEVRGRLGTKPAQQFDHRGATMGRDAVLGLVREILAETRSLSTGSARNAANLSERERDIIVLVAEGLTDAEISQKLFISIRTVQSYLERIKHKTGARRRAELTRLALRQGLA